MKLLLRRTLVRFEFYSAAHAETIAAAAFQLLISMPFIKIETFIHAKTQLVFDLSRSIDLHQTSMNHTNEKAIAGITTGLINEGETVTWTAKHFFKTRRLKVQITQMKPYEFFEDEMLEGDFKSMKHKHIFRPEGSSTKMIDEFSFEAPYGFIGKFFSYIFLTAYMKALLMQRNRVIKNLLKPKSGKQFYHKPTYKIHLPQTLIC